MLTSRQIKLQIIKINIELMQAIQDDNTVRLLELQYAKVLLYQTLVDTLEATIKLMYVEV